MNTRLRTDGSAANQSFPRLRALGALLVLACVSGPAYGQGQGTKPLQPYVVAFTFQAGYSFDNLMSKEQIAVFNASALDGWGLKFTGAYTTAPVKSPAELADAIAFLNSDTHAGKDIWPTLFITRILQPGGKGAMGQHPPEQRRALARIPGIDLENETGARAAFERDWRNALLVARALGSPGIMFDPEEYTNGDMHRMGRLAEIRGEEESVAAAKCEAFGARLADIVQEVHPDAVVIWFFTGLHEPEEEWSPVARICLGAVKRALSISSKQLHVDGGESGIGYLHRSVKALQTRIHNRWIETRELVPRYPNYELGGVLAPFVDVNTRVAWMTFNRIGDEETAADFQPHFELLFRNYRYTWLYGTHSQGLTGFNPWEPQHSAAMSAPLRRAKAKAVYAPPNLATMPAEKLPEGDTFDSLDYEELKREVWADLASPGAARIVPRYWRGAAQDPNADTGQGGRVIPEPVEAGGRKWTARIEFDGTKVKHWPWPGVSITNLPITDISSYRGMAVEVYNPNDKPLRVRFALFTFGEYPSDQWGCGTSEIAPGASEVFSYTGVTKPINAISFAGVRQQDPLMTIYVSPVFLIR